MNSYQQWQIVVKLYIPLFRYFYNHLSNYTKTIIRLRLENIGEYSLRLRRIIVKYYHCIGVLLIFPCQAYNKVAHFHMIFCVLGACKSALKDV